MPGDAAGRVLSGGGAVTVQLIIAGGSLILQAIATRTLGAAGYGTYAVLYSILVLLLAVQTSWVGDSLTVFDRFDPRIQGAILISVLATVGR